MNPQTVLLVQRVLWQHSGGTEEEILLNLIQSETSLRKNFVAFSAYVLLSEWMSEWLFGSEMSHRFFGSECEYLGVVVSDCSVYVCALLHFEITARVRTCIDSTLCGYEHGCNGEEQNDKDKAGNRQLEQQMEYRRSS